MINRRELRGTRRHEEAISLSLFPPCQCGAGERDETGRDENKISSVFLPLQREKKSDERERE
jgi:hypothetical protein